MTCARARKMRKFDTGAAPRGEAMDMNLYWLTLAGIFGILAFLWILHRDMRSLSARV